MNQSTEIRTTGLTCVRRYAPILGRLVQWALDNRWGDYRETIKRLPGCVSLLETMSPLTSIEYALYQLHFCVSTS